MSVSFAAEIATPYEDLLAKILRDGTPKGDRTGTGTTSLFAQQLRFDLADSFISFYEKLLNGKELL